MPGFTSPRPARAMERERLIGSENGFYKKGYLKHLHGGLARWKIGAADEDTTYRSADYENPFFFLPGPLDHFVGALSEGVPAGVRTGDAVHFEQRRYPGEGDGVAADAVVDF